MKQNKKKTRTNTTKPCMNSLVWYACHIGIKSLINCSKSTKNKPSTVRKQSAQPKMIHRGTSCAMGRTEDERAHTLVYTHVRDQTNERSVEKRSCQNNEAIHHIPSSKTTKSSFYECSSNYCGYTPKKHMYTRFTE